MHELVAKFSISCYWKIPELFCYFPFCILEQLLLTRISVKFLLNITVITDRDHFNNLSPINVSVSGGTRALDLQQRVVNPWKHGNEVWGIRK